MKERTMELQPVLVDDPQIVWVGGIPMDRAHANKLVELGQLSVASIKDTKNSKCIGADNL